MSGSAGLLITPLYIANFLLMLSGAALAGVGGYAAHLLRSQAHAAPLLLGAGAGSALAGAAAAAAAAYGYWALHKRDHNALRNYSNMMIVTMALHGVLGFAAFALDTDVSVEAGKVVDGMELRSLHFVERYFQCCGKTNVEIYRAPSGHYLLPESCCPPLLTSVCLQKGYHFSITCTGAVNSFAFGLACKVAIGCFILCLFEMVLIISACCLAGHFKKFNTLRTSYEMSHRSSNSP